MVNSLMGTLTANEYEMVGVWKFKLPSESWDNHFPQLYQLVGQSVDNLDQAVLDAQAHIDELKAQLVFEWGFGLDIQQQEGQA